jgi:hypothetical protein
MDQRVQNAIARIEVASDGKVIRQGTASLVGANLVLTALHVVAERGTDPLRILQGEISLTFPNQFPVRATVHERKWDAGEDWVLLTCTTQLPETIRPLPLAKIERDGDNWETHGFPGAKPDGLTVGGIVRNIHGNVQGEWAYQLLCDEAGAGQGLRVMGLSGAPVIIDKAVVGVIRWAILTDERDEGGTLYACPASLIADRCPDYFPEVKTVSPAPPATMTASLKWLAAGAALVLSLGEVLSLAEHGGVSDLPKPIPPPRSPIKETPIIENGPTPQPDDPTGKRERTKGPTGPTRTNPEPPDIPPVPEPQVDKALILKLTDLQLKKAVIVPILDDLRGRQSAIFGFGLRPDMALAETRMIHSLSAAAAEIGRPDFNLETVSLSLRDAENAIETLEEFLNIKKVK